MRVARDRLIGRRSARPRRWIIATNGCAPQAAGPRAAASVCRRFIRRTARRLHLRRLAASPSDWPCPIGCITRALWPQIEKHQRRRDGISSLPSVSRTQGGHIIPPAVRIINHVADTPRSCLRPRPTVAVMDFEVKPVAFVFSCWRARPAGHSSGPQLVARQVHGFTLASARRDACDATRGAHLSLCVRFFATPTDMHRRGAQI